MVPNKEDMDPGISVRADARAATIPDWLCGNFCQTVPPYTTLNNPLCHSSTYCEYPPNGGQPTCGLTGT